MAGRGHDLAAALPRRLPDRPGRSRRRPRRVVDRLQRLDRQLRRPQRPARNLPRPRHLPGADRRLRLRRRNGNVRRSASGRTRRTRPSAVRFRHTAPHRLQPARSQLPAPWPLAACPGTFGNTDIWSAPPAEVSTVEGRHPVAPPLSGALTRPVPPADQLTLPIALLERRPCNRQADHRLTSASLPPVSGGWSRS